MEDEEQVMKVYIVPNQKKPEAIQAVLCAAGILKKHNVTVLLAETAKAWCQIQDAEYLSVQRCYEAADVILTAGGDGTLLHEAELAARYNRPILGLNVGRCGFLATCEPEELEEKLPLLARGSYKLDTRSLLFAQEQREDGFSGYALNDVILTKGQLHQAVEFNIYCDGILVEHYRGDGVIVATPTGSTAYSLSAGGPILDAQTRAIVVTPICPHSMQSPAIVFAPERKITIQVGQLQEGEDVYASCDGKKVYPLYTGATVTIALSEQTVQLVTFSQADQFRAIDQKLKNRS